jgi:hypothetical protein
MNKREKEAHEVYRQHQLMGDVIKSSNDVKIEWSTERGKVKDVHFYGYLSKYNDKKLSEEEYDFCVAYMNNQLTLEQLDEVLSRDTRYNTPKAAPKASEDIVEKTILETEIYRQARVAILLSKNFGRESIHKMLKAQRKQVAYGIDKYPEPLNANTWSIDETVEHIMDESIDKLHYLIMLRIKLEQLLASMRNDDIIEFRNTSSRIATVSRMINETISHMDYLAMLNVSRPNDSMDAIAYGLKMMDGVHNGN